jgi:hypothetical protein
VFNFLDNLLTKPCKLISYKANALSPIYNNSIALKAKYNGGKHISQYSKAILQFYIPACCHYHYTRLKKK